MSYSAKVKSEIIQQLDMARPEFMALLSAVMKVSGTMSLLPGKGIGFRIATENAGTARFLTRQLKVLVDPAVQVMVSRGATMKKKNLYFISFDEVKDLKELLFETGILSTQGEHLMIDDSIPARWIRTDTLKRAYLRGAFLGSGSISNPEKQYHLEFVTHSEHYGSELVRLLASYNLTAKVISRKGSYVVYLKEGEQIVDLLNVMGAHQALLETENIRIMKGMRNNVNRLVNCETANLSKTVNAAVRQMDAIRLIQRTIGLDRLPDILRQVAELRVNYPDATLQELGEMMEPPVGKSGVNHRLRKIETIAQEIEG